MIINGLGMREISAEEARKIGVDLTYVATIHDRKTKRSRKASILYLCS